MTTQQKFWKPEPRRHSVAWFSLIIPAFVYVAGVVAYSHGAFVGEVVANSQQLGSALMVIGGEAGTIGAVSEVFRKHLNPDEKCGIFDWVGMGVSLIATLGNNFVVYCALTTIVATWVSLVRMYGPFILLLCSGLDSYYSLAEFGFYNAGFERRWEKWNQQRHVWEQRKLSANVPTPAEDAPEVAAEPAALVPQLAADVPEAAGMPQARVADWRKIAAGLNGETAELTASGIVAVLEQNGFTAPSARTCRNWVNEAREKHAAVAQ